MDLPSGGGAGQSSSVSRAVPMRRMLLGGLYSNNPMFVWQTCHLCHSEPSDMAPAGVPLLLSCLLRPSYTFPSPLHPFSKIILPSELSQLLFSSPCGGPSFCGINEGVLKCIFTESPSLIALVLEGSKWERKRSRSVG